MSSNRLLTNSVIFFAGTLVLSVFNYLYNSFMGRLLGPASYSIIGSLLAFVSIITLPTNAFATVTMRFTAHYHARGEDGMIRTFFNRLTYRLLLLAVGAAVLLIILSPWLTNFLHLPSALPIILIAPLLVFTILLPVNRGVLQGLQNFSQAILNQNIDPFLKLVLGIGLVKLGFGINGAVGALAVASLIAYLASFIPLGVIRKKPATPIHAIPREVKEFSVVALVAFLLATVLMNIDILLIKHFMPPREAGLYAALSTMGKIILFVTTPVVSVMFPMISDLQGRNEKHYRVLLQSMIMVVFIGLVGVVGYYLFPTRVVSVLYGQSYVGVSPLLGLFGVVMLLFSLINLWINYFLSIGNRLFLGPLVVSAVVEIGLLWARHADFLAVIQDLLVAMIVGFGLLTGYYLLTKREQLAQLLTGKGFAQ